MLHIFMKIEKFILKTSWAASQCPNMDDPQVYEANAVPLHAVNLKSHIWLLASVGNMASTWLSQTERIIY